MSVESVAKALNVPDLAAAERLVLVGIANHDGDGGAWPAIATLARYACCSTRHVQRTIRSLEQRGLVTVHEHGGGVPEMRDDRRPNRYTLHLDHKPVDNSVDGVTPTSPRKERGDTQVADEVTPTSPELSLEPSCITSENVFTRAELEKAARRLRDEHRRTHAQRLIKPASVQAFADERPQPPIRLAALALLGEHQPLIHWRANQTALNDNSEGPAPASGADGVEIARRAKHALTQGDDTSTLTP